MYFLFDLGRKYLVDHLHLKQREKEKERKKEEEKNCVLT